MNRQSAFTLIYGHLALLVCIACQFSAARAQSDPPELSKAVKLVRDNAKMIVFFALPSYAYKEHGFSDARQLENGYEVTYNFHVKSSFFSNNMKLAFYFDKAGQYDFCKVLSTTTAYEPFKSAVGAKHLKTLRALLNEIPEVKADEKLLQYVENANAERLLALYMQLQQKKEKK